MEYPEHRETYFTAFIDDFNQITGFLYIFNYFRQQLINNLYVYLLFFAISTLQNRFFIVILRQNNRTWRRFTAHTPI